MIQFSKHKKSFTLVDVLIGTFLLLVVFLGIFSAYQSGLKVISQSKARTGATATANQKIETIRNLSYQALGVKGGYPSGDIEPTENLTRNNINYTVATRVDYINDSFDGIGGDFCPNDYKKVEIRVSWSGQYEGEISLVTDISPKGIFQECAEIGGTLFVSVFNASGLSITGVNVDLEDVVSGLKKSCFTDGGDCFFVLPESIETYKISVSKTGYSTERTYGKNEIVDSTILANPSKIHATIFEGQVTSISFSIDNLSNLSIDTQSPESEGYWSDSFLDQNKIEELNNLLVSDGEVKLTIYEGEYSSSGYLISKTIIPSQLLKWKEFSFNDAELTDTDLKYQFLYFDGTSWALIPDTDLVGNFTGFDTSPIDISGLPKGKYPEIRLKANFSTADFLKTPVLYDWTVTWKSSQPKKIANVVFHLQGVKILGTDSEDNPVYKYSNDHITNQIGHIDISNLEWDSYGFSVDKFLTGLDLLSSEPEQPINLLPGTMQSVILNLKAENTLLVTIRDSTTLNPIFAASVRVYNLSLGYDMTQPTDGIGQAFFIPLQATTYNLEVQAPDYSIYSGTVSVSGDSAKIINLQRVE